MIGRRILKILEINEHFVKGVFLESFFSFFNYPFDSANFGILETKDNEKFTDTPEEFRIEEIRLKVARLTIKEINVYIPMLH